MTPQHPPAAPMNFELAIDDAVRASAQYKKTYNHALDLGIRPEDIVLYATGALSPSARDEFQQQLLQSPWALSRVVAFMKAKRARGFVFVELSDDDAVSCERLNML